MPKTNTLKGDSIHRSKSISHSKRQHFEFSVLHTRCQALLVTRLFCTHVHTPTRIVKDDRKCKTLLANKIANAISKQNQQRSRRREKESEKNSLTRSSTRGSKGRKAMQCFLAKQRPIKTRI